MSKNCNHPTCFDSPVCRREKKPKPVRKRLSRFSNRRQKINVEYRKEVAKFIEQNPACRINSPDCIRVAQGVHHKKGRATIKRLMDKKWWMPACNPCNEWVEKNDKQARKQGHKKSKFNDK